jgi:hypothetical protein
MVGGVWNRNVNRWEVRRLSAPLIRPFAFQAKAHLLPQGEKGSWGRSFSKNASVAKGAPFSP